MLFVGLPTLLLAQSGRKPARHPFVRNTQAAIRIDGRLSEAVWSIADSIVDFRQREPSKGASKRAHGRQIIRDAERLYVAVRAWDRDIAPRAAHRCGAMTSPPTTTSRSQ